MISLKEGYLILALGSKRYLEMAANLACSIRVMDNKRPICIVHDTNINVGPELAHLFDHKVLLDTDPRYPHVMNKLRLFELSPYELTMFVDADCLLVKNDIDYHWNRAQKKPFSITGGKVTSGEWKGIDIAKILRQEGSPYLIKMNAGVFCFDKSKEAKNFFDGVNDFYLRRREVLNISLYHGERTQTDELYLGIFMGMQGMDCDNVNNVGMNSWMVSTWRAVYCDFRPQNGRSLIYKTDKHLFGIPVLPMKIVRLSPTFAHFIGLKPRRVYRRITSQFRAMERIGK